MRSIKEIRVENLEKLIEAVGSRKKFTDQQIAEDLNIAYGYVGLLLNGHSNIGDKVARKLEIVGGKPKYWLDTDSTSISETSALYTAHTETPNITEGPESKGEVPLISWVQAGDWCEAVDLFSPGDAENWLPCPVNHSDKTFILRVQGTSMEPEYRDGDLIFVDPLVEATHNSDIVVRLENSNSATFKRLQLVDGKQYLSPINRDWPEQVIPVTELANICGVVVFSGRLR